MSVRPPHPNVLESKMVLFNSLTRHPSSATETVSRRRPDALTSLSFILAACTMTIQSGSAAIGYKR